MDMELEGQFPTNINIEDTRTAIKGREDFREIIFSDHSIFVYFMGMSKDIFPNPKIAPDERTAYLWNLRRECRGLVFGNDGKVISRRFHKFFNVNETEETNSDKIDLQRPFVITEKLDGTMIAPYHILGTLRYATKAGVTDNTLLVEDFVARNPEIPYTQFSIEWIEKSFTPIFEYCGPKAPIVLTYKEESLKLITLRHTVTGQYIPYSKLKIIASVAGIPLVQAWEPEELGIDVNDLSSFNLFEKKMKQAKFVEGFVLRFNDGDMLKIKTNWYFSLNKSLDKIKNCSERHLWISILKEEYDDMKSFLPDPLRGEMDAFADELDARVRSTTLRLVGMVREHEGKTKKEISSWVQKLPNFERKLVWEVREILGKCQGNMEEVVRCVRVKLVEEILHNLGSAKSWKGMVVPLLGNLQFRKNDNV